MWGSLWALLAAAGLLLGVFRRICRRHELTVIAGFLAAACLVAMFWRQGMQAGFDDNVYVLHTGGRADFHGESPAVETVRADRAAPFRAVGFGDNLFAGWTGVYGLEGIAGPDALMDRHYRELLDACEFAREWDWRRVVHRETLAALKPVYDFLNIKYYFAADGSPVPPGNVLQPVVQADLTCTAAPRLAPGLSSPTRSVSYDVPIQLAAPHQKPPRAAVRRRAAG